MGSMSRTIHTCISYACLAKHWFTGPKLKTHNTSYVPINKESGLRVFEWVSALSTPTVITITLLIHPHVPCVTKLIRQLFITSLHAHPTRMLVNHFLILYKLFLESTQTIFKFCFLLYLKDIMCTLGNMPNYCLVLQYI